MTKHWTPPKLTPVTELARKTKQYMHELQYEDASLGDKHSKAANWAETLTEQLCARMGHSRYGHEVGAVTQIRHAFKPIHDVCERLYIIQANFPAVAEYPLLPSQQPAWLDRHKLTEP